MNSISRFLGRGHNSRSRIEALEKKARFRQVKAQQAWVALLKAQVEENEPWVHLLSAAAMTGVKTDDLRRKLDVSPPTFSRWVSGLHSPSQSLRTRLGWEVVALAEAHQDKVAALDR